MKYLIISDIHSNYEAFKSCWSAVRRKRIDKVIILGDLVGYGASPNQVIDEIKKIKNKIIIRGNHDKVAAGLESGNNFNKPAALSAQWTYNKLTLANKNYLRKLPSGPISVEEKFAIVHGSPLHEDDYIFSEYDALEVFYNTDMQIYFFGHTHYPIIYSLYRNVIQTIKIGIDKQKLILNKEARYLINPGSIGQPRDKCPYASLAIWDSNKWQLTIFRIPYNITLAQQKIMKAGLPSSLAARLSLGV